MDAQRTVLCGEDAAEHGGSRAAPGIHPAGSRAGQPDAAPRRRPAAAEVAKARGIYRHSETDDLSHLDFPEQHRAKIHSTNPREPLNEKEVKRRADVVGIFPNEASIIRLIGAVLLEQNDEWQLQHRYMQVEAMAELVTPANEAAAKQIAAAA